MGRKSRIGRDDALIAMIFAEVSAMGTLAIMSPEQASAEPLTTQSDIYGLDAVLYRLLSGADPFSGSSIFSILKQVVEQPPPSLW